MFLYISVDYLRMNNNDESDRSNIVMKTTPISFTLDYPIFQMVHHFYIIMLLKCKKVGFTTNRSYLDSVKLSRDYEANILLISHCLGKEI